MEKNIIHILGSFLAGIGLFFIGVGVIGVNLRLMTDRRIRKRIKALARNPWMAGMFGVVAGTVSQSASAISLILSGMITAGMLSLKRAIPIILWANIGNCILVFLVLINFHVIILYWLGLMGILYYTEANGHKGIGPLLGAFLGGALLFYGVDLISTGANAIRNYEGFTEFLEIAGKSYLLSLGIGIIASFLVQSGPTVSAITIALVHNGVLSFEPGLMIIYGSNMGSVISKFLLSFTMDVAARRVTWFLVLFTLFGLLAYVFLFYIEIWTHIPLVMGLLHHLFVSYSLALAFAYLFVQVTSAISFFFFKEKVASAIEGFFPESKEDRLAKPRYIYDQALAEPVTALELLERDELRLVERFPYYLDCIRQDTKMTAAYPLETVHGATETLIGELMGYVQELAGLSKSSDVAAGLLVVRGRIELLENIEEALNNYVMAIEGKHFSRDLESLKDSITETLHTLLLMIIDLRKNYDQMDFNLILTLTADRSDMMNRLHKEIRLKNPNLLLGEQAIMEDMLICFEHLVWNIRAYAKMGHEEEKE